MATAAARAIARLVRVSVTSPVRVQGTVACSARAFATAVPPAATAAARKQAVSDVLTRRRNQRFWAIGGAMCLGGTALFFLLDALQENLMFYITPTEVIEKADQLRAQNKKFRLGGLVREGSVKFINDPPSVTFVVTDLNNEVDVRFTGIVPDLFGEGSGCVCEGRLTEGNLFVATEVLAKHDENYMPKDVAEAVMKNRKMKEAEAEVQAERSRQPST